MHTPPNLPALDPDRYNTLVDAAKARARTLRREAVDTFWNGMGHWCRQGMGSAQRAAQRLAHRQAQHTRQRSA